MKGKSNFLELYLHPATRQNLVEPIYPDKPKYPRRNTVLLKSYAEIKCARDEKKNPQLVFLREGGMSAVRYSFY